MEALKSLLTLTYLLLLTTHEESMMLSFAVSG